MVHDMNGSSKVYLHIYYTLHNDKTILLFKTSAHEKSYNI